MTRRGLLKTEFGDHALNAAYGVLDYLIYPLGMLMVAPIAVRALGISQYGVWAFTSAAVSTGSIVASGFGDANIRLVATSRTGDSRNLGQAVRSAMGIHLVLGATMMLISFLLAPAAAAHLAPFDATLRFQCKVSMYVAGILMLGRAIESVCISTQRGFERYGDAVRISIVGRIVTLAAVAILPLAKLGVISVMLATAVVTAFSLRVQVVRLKHLLQVESLWPSFDTSAARALFGFGIFTWIQAVAGLLFGQIDRLITGVSLGAAAVASYALCVQMAQPIYGLAASGLHFLFPYLSARHAGNSAAALQRPVLFSLGANLLLVASGTAFLLTFGAALLRVLGGKAVSLAGTPILPLIIVSTALPALSVTGSYALLALGRARAVTLFNLAGGALMVLLIPLLLPRFGMYGMAMARMAYGPVTLLVYVPLGALLWRNSPAPSSAKEPAALLEEA